MRESRPEAAASPRDHTAAHWVFRIGTSPVHWLWADGVGPDPRSLGPYRLPKATAFAKHSPAHAYCHTTGSHLLVESGLERELAEELDGDPEIAWLVAQPFALYFADPQRERRQLKHIPDLLTVRQDGGVTVWDVRPLARQDERFLRIAQWTRSACAAVGWRYEVFPGHSPTRRVNQLWISAYRQPVPWIAALEDMLHEGLTDGTLQTVGDVYARDAGYGQLVRALYYCIWSHKIRCDLDAPITSETELAWV